MRRVIKNIFKNGEKHKEKGGKIVSQTDSGTSHNSAGSSPAGFLLIWLSTVQKKKKKLNTTDNIQPPSFSLFFFFFSSFFKHAFVVAEKVKRFFFCFQSKLSGQAANRTFTRQISPDALVILSLQSIIVSEWLMDLFIRRKQVWHQLTHNQSQVTAHMLVLTILKLT